MGLGKTLVVIALIASNRPGVSSPAVYNGVINGVDEVPSLGLGSEDAAGPSQPKGKEGKGAKPKKRRRGGIKRVEEEEKEDNSGDVEIVAEVPPPRKPSKQKKAALLLSTSTPSMTGPVSPGGTLSQVGIAHVSLYAWGPVPGVTIMGSEDGVQSPPKLLLTNMFFDG